MKKIKVGVIGVGRLGSEHARIYAGMKNAVLIAVADTKESRANEIAAKYGAESSADYASFYGKVDAVSIAVPTQLHYKIAGDFIKKNVHVLLEKPIARMLNEAEKLVLLSDKKKIILQVGHVERFNSAFRHIEKNISDPRFIECHRLGPYQKRGTEVGVVLDLMIHDIDIILNLVKSPIMRIDAVGVSVLSKYEDIANVRIVFKNGAVANITSSRISTEKLRKIRIFEKNTYISLDFLKQDIEVYKRSSSGIKREKHSVRKIEPLKLELEHFVYCVSCEKKPIVSGQPATEALRIALKISKQINKG